MGEAELRTFYEREAAARDERTPDPRRTLVRKQFSELLGREGRRSIVEPGCGPGHDGAAFVAEGFDWTGVDLAQAHVDLCRAKGLAAVRGSLRALPFDDAQFDGAWTMSTLLHVPDADLDLVLGELARVVGPAGPIAVGLWTRGEDEETTSDDDRESVPDAPPRLFVLRSEQTVRRRFGEHGVVEDFRTWPGKGAFMYQWFVLRPR